VLKAIDAPPAEWKSPLNAFEHVLDHEQRVTGLINKLVTTAAGENDYATQQFLQWFVAEQVEEEENADAIVRQLKLIGDNPHALLMLDRELATRVFVPPVAAGGSAQAGAAAA
jgi:ferritin